MNRVLIFIDWFAPGYKAGGPITSNVNIVDHLSQDVKFYIITSSFDYHATKPYEDVTENKWIDWHGAKVMYINPSCISWAILKKATQEAACDIWYINGIYSKYYSIYPLLLAKSMKPSKTIVSTRGMLSPHALAVKTFHKKFFLSLAKLIGLYKDIVFHTTNEEEKGYVEQAISKHNTIIVAENLPRKMELQTYWCKKQVGEIRMVSFARISPEKNTLFAIQALSKCKERVIYDIYGQINSETYWQECQKIIKALPPNIIVKYKGSVSPQEMPQLYKNYHVMYLPSTGENYGHAILESFMNGCPVVISNKTPWLNLQNIKIGWDLPLEENLYSPVIDNLSLMNEGNFQSIRNNVLKFINNYLSNDSVKNQYLKMFSLSHK